jgi:hypothetical protein
VHADPGELLLLPIKRQAFHILGDGDVYERAG